MALRSRSRGALRALLGFCGALPLVQACGGRSDTEEYLFGDDPITVGGSSSTGGSATAGSTTGVGGSIGVGASAGVGASSPVGGSIGAAGEPSVGGTGIAGSSQGGNATAGTTGVAGTSGVAGAAGAPGGAPLTCGGDVCDADTQSCCAGFGGFQCVAKGGQCQGAVLGCTTNDDCGGMDVCCISITGDANAASSCKPQCNVMGGGRDRQLCQVDADCRAPFRFCTATVFGVNICTRRP